MSMRSRTLATLGAGIILGFSAALAGNALAGRQSTTERSAAPAATLPWEEARLFAEVYERIKREYIDDVDDHGLMEKAVRGMVAALDPHSAFLDSEEFEEIRLSTMGSYPGVGIEVVAEEGGVKILRPIEGSPAQEAGMLAGDFIVKIDGVEVGADLPGAINRMRGPAGSTVRLTVRRPPRNELLDFSLRRAKVEVRSVAQQELEPGYGYVRITGFSETTADDVARALAHLKRDNPQGLKGLILDLRNNPGGVLEAALRWRTRSSTTASSSPPTGAPPIRSFGWTQRRGSHQRRSHRSAGQRRIGLCGGNPGGRAQGPRSGRACRSQDLRQGIGADGDAALARRRAQAHHLALLHPLRRVDS